MFSVFSLTHTHITNTLAHFLSLKNSLAQYNNTCILIAKAYTARNIL